MDIGGKALIRKYLNKRVLSIKKSLIYYIVISSLLSVIISIGVMNGARVIQNSVWSKYKTIVEYKEIYDFYNKYYGYITEAPRISSSFMSQSDNIIVEICDFLETWTLLIITITLNSITSYLFFKRKLKIPLSLLEKVANVIFNNNLDFEIDYDYMEISIRELSAYLSICGLDSYELNSSEKNALKHFQNNKVKYKVYKLGEGNERLFDISSPKKRFNANTITFGGKYPYVVRSSLNNGIRGYITQDECYLNPAKTISFGQDTATIFYQEKPYFTGDKIKVMSYRDCELNPELACYLLTVMRKAFQNFAWGQSSFNENVLKNMEIRLPVDSNDNIDYTYITAFIKAQEKLSIKNVIDWKDKIINTSKKCI